DCHEGAENNDYALLDEPYQARNGPMESVGELRLVKGMTTEIYRKIAPYLTVYPLNTADTDCASRLTTLTDHAAENEKLPCFDDKVNLHAAADAVIEAWAVGGYNPQYYTEAVPGRELPEFREEVLQALNCARIPQKTGVDLGCPDTKSETPASEAPGDCWRSNADVKKLLEKTNVSSIIEVGDTQNVGAAAKKGLDCAASGTPTIDGRGSSNQTFRRLVSDFITIEAIGYVGLPEDEEAEEEELVAEDSEEDEDEEEVENPEPDRIQARITATYHIDASQAEVKLILLRWSEE
ncbi:MAG: hypothetical protein AB1405_18305, partial [Bdellovibrionota bacterium]